jgi:uncharacterized protein
LNAEVFADASAVVKLYADEAGAQRVRAAERLVISQVTRVEVPAALWKKHRMTELSATSVGTLLAELEADLFGTVDEPPRLLAVTASAAVLENAARLAGVHGLRAYDAVQLASGLAARQAVENLAFLAFDELLCRAAIAEGFELLG